jgi:hypothetical protein
MKKGCFYTHQGWTDIINCLPLINYYSKNYDELVVVVREDSKPILDYYTKHLKNVIMYYVSKPILDTSVLNLPYDYDILYHGYHDRFRNDKYINKFSQHNGFFVKAFYETYDIPFFEKVNSFELVRDLDLEQNKYEEFIKEYGENYIIVHDDQNSPGGETGINLSDVLKEKNNIVNVNSKTKNVFDYIKILENAKEIHLVDSIWAATCYLIDSKYSFFKDKEINLYAFKTRGGGTIEKYGDKTITPFHPKNWTIHNI